MPLTDLPPTDLPTIKKGRMPPEGERWKDKMTSRAITFDEAWNDLDPLWPYEPLEQTPPAEVQI